MQIDDVLSSNLPSNQVNNMISGNDINLSAGSGGVNSSDTSVNNIPNGNNNGVSISPLQEAIIRRSAANNVPNSAGINTSPTTTTADSTAKSPQDASLTPPRSQENQTIPGNGDRVPTASTQGNNRLLDAQTNQLNSSRATGSAPRQHSKLC